MERRCARPPPLGFPRPCRRRPVAREKAFELPAGEEVLERAPHARAQPREGGGAERGGLDHVRPRHGHSQEVRLEVPVARDRKSTRLNSSHGYISYAVFCLKKKKKKKPRL